METNSFKKITIRALCFSALLYSIFTALRASAQNVTTENPVFSENLAKKMQRWSSGFAQQIGFNVVSLPGIIALLIFTILSVLAVVFIGLVFYGGYKWMMARGNEQEVEEARAIIRHAFIGLIVLLASYALGYFILYYLITGGAGEGRPAGPYN